MIPINVVKIRKYGSGSFYLPLSKDLIIKRGLNEGDSFMCYETEDGFKFVKVPSITPTSPEIEVTAE